jgi:Fe(3+) dicitrate transport protein
MKVLMVVLQLSIGGRGLDPNRTSNFNTRQMAMTSVLMYYPESYYATPTEALEETVIRGAVSLQHGTQFGVW